MNNEDLAEILTRPGYRLSRENRPSAKYYIVTRRDHAAPAMVHREGCSVLKRATHAKEWNRNPILEDKYNHFEPHSCLSPEERKSPAFAGDLSRADSKQGNAAPERSEPVEPPQDAQGRVFTLELPLPPRECSRNTAVHWGTRARATREYRETCGLHARAQLGKRRAQGHITIDFDFYLCRGSFRAFNASLYFPKDEANALDACKAAVDSLQDTGLIKADTKKYVKIGTVNLYTTKKEHQGQTKLVMTIREA